MPPLRAYLHTPIRCTIALLMKTLRWQVVGLEELTTQSQQGILVCAWHDELALTTYFLKKHRVPATMVVSHHQDGQIIADILSDWGFLLLRGSTQSKGAITTAKQMLKDLKKPGHIIALTADGPTGPRHQMKPGAIKVARQCDAKILLLRASVQHCWRLQSWDRFIIPKPFSLAKIILAPTAVIQHEDGSIDIDAMSQALSNLEP